MVKAALSLRFVNFVNVRIGKPKERECAAIRQTIERVAIADYPFRKIWKLTDLGPRRYQRHSDNVLVELARAFVIFHHAGIVMQPLRKLLFQICAHLFSLQYCRTPITRTVSRDRRDPYQAPAPTGHDDPSQGRSRRPRHEC